ncbi:MAG: hypothetical protein JW774_08045 [Candidatus Aureabacteria bacterium]|nr:hypothetical protein [Candidatus Auribacterota bacterium]
MNKYVLCFLFSVMLFPLLCGESTVSKKENFVYDSKGKRDPFFAVSEDTGPKVPEPSLDELTGRQKLEKAGIKLNTIVWDMKRPAILVDGDDNIYGIGDRVKGIAVIRTVEKEYVVFEVDGELVEVTIQ